MPRRLRMGTGRVMTQTEVAGDPVQRVSVASDLAPRAENVHFEDRFEAGELRFDYRMKPGPVTRSNAIALMRAVGLDVDVDSSGTKL